jgi:fumarylacetoacetase
LLGRVRQGAGAALSWPAPDSTHDLALPCWVPGAHLHPEFPIQNLPLGIFDPGDDLPRAGTRIGDSILDLRAAAEAGLLPEPAGSALGGTTLNALLALPREARSGLRHRLSALLADEAQEGVLAPMLFNAGSCTMQLPCTIGDYTDFYVGIHHATNVGRQFRPDNPLLPNYKYVPIGYHGRSSSIRPSAVPVVRPSGQRKPPESDAPEYGPSRRLDYELELGVWIGPGNALGTPIPIAEAAAHVAGLCLLNDWSARDLQAWEYQPLGPFLAKNFHTTVSPWIVTAEALAPYFIAQPPRPAGDPEPLDYLRDPEDQRRGALGLGLEVHLLTERMRASGEPPHRLSSGQASVMYWTVAQMVAHHASGGCNLRPGDLLGTGTLSGETRDSCGSLLEISGGGTDPLQLPNGESRCFLEDGDEVILTVRGARDGYATIGFGECRARIQGQP